MINKKSFINEGNLNKLIQNDGKNIVNLKEDSFEYCNGMFLVNCTYDLDSVIQKLFRVGAISNYKNWVPSMTRDLTNIIACEKEIGALPTAYLKITDNKLCNIFKIGDKYVSYKKEFIDIFRNVQFKASDAQQIPYLRIYGDDEFIGLLMPMRDEHDLLVDIIGS